MDDLRVKAEKIMSWAEEKKAENVTIIDVSEKSSFTDFFVICSGSGVLHTRAIADNIIDMAKKEKFHLLGKEGVDNAQWILLDYADVVVHIFDESIREFYNLEDLWEKIPVRKD